MTIHKIYIKLCKLYLTICMVSAILFMSKGAALFQRRDTMDDPKEAFVMSMEWIMGFIVGLLLVVLIAVIIYKFVVKGRGKESTYDERQQIARGRAFTFAYTTLLIYLGVWFVLRSMEVPFFYESLSVWLGVLLSLGVFVGYSVFHDAYFRASDSPKYWMVVLGGVGLLNLVLGVRRLLTETTLKEKLYENFNLPLGVLMAAVLVCVLIKRMMDRNGEGD